MKYETERVKYLKTLPKDKDGNPIINDEAEMTLSNMNWESEFLDEIGVLAQDYPEYYQIEK
tara:strand:- start:262 stop:444 length:183 start_codon:yes stop_codon:yes gene_type:complete